MNEAIESPRADLSDPSPLDPEALDLIRELGAAGSTDLFREVIGLFLQDAPTKMGMIRRALDDSDGKGLREASHSLKGSSGNFGAQQLVSLLAKLEKLGQLEELSEAERLFPEVEGEYGRVEQALKEEVAKAK